MKNYEQHIIQARGCMSGNYAGRFAKIDNEIYFYFPNGKELCCIKFGDPSKTVIIPTPGELLPLPRRWELIECDHEQYLFMNRFMNNGIVVNLRSPDTMPSPSEKVLYQNELAKKPEKYYVEASFTFGEYCISHKGEWGYICTKDTKKIWEFKGWAYLYTPIYRWNDYIYFGTAGQGGYFYMLDLKTGKPVLEIKTRGTAYIERCGNLCYITQRDKESKLLCVDLNTGKIVDQVLLFGKATQDSVIRVIDDDIHVITYLYKKDILQQVIWNRINAKQN